MTYPTTKGDQIQVNFMAVMIRESSIKSGDIPNDKEWPESGQLYGSHDKRVQY